MTLFVRLLSIPVGILAGTMWDDNPALSLVILALAVSVNMLSLVIDDQRRP